MPKGTPIDREKLRSVGVIGRRSGPRVREGRDANGDRYKAVTDELNSTVTQRAGDRQDVLIRAPHVRAQVAVRETRD